ncbi:MAG: hypothetical protein M0R74_11890 [Dehalococcoidia bacterium]|nr:hypothetical protein [Dehalococcoidia bacterium]
MSGFDQGRYIHMQKLKSAASEARSESRWAFRALREITALPDDASLEDAKAIARRALDSLDD